jgi:hypothetical protein
MDCNTARLLLCFTGRPPGELDKGEGAELEAHLASCPDCAALAVAEHRLDAHVGRAVRDVPVPEGLGAALLTRLGAERDAFYRRLLVRAAGIAALLVVTVGACWYYLGRPTTVQVEEILAVGGEQIEAPPAEVEAWLQRVGGSRLSAPPQFEYAFLVAHGIDQLKGHDVPFLLFVRPSEQGGGALWARVYVMGDRAFNLDDLPEQSVGLSGKAGTQAVVLRNADNEHVAYVVIFTGMDLNLFFKPGQSGGVLTQVFPARRTPGTSG